MAKDPAFLFYYSDFLVGTSFLTLEETGAYIKILCHLADMGRLDKKDMLNICQRQQNILDTIITKLTQDENGLFYNKRLEEEVIKRKNYAESRRLNRQTKGKKVKPNKKDMLNICQTYDKHMEDININKDINKDKDKKEKEPAPLKIKYAEFMTLTEKQYQTLITEHGEKLTKAFIEKVNNHKGAKGIKYTSDYHAIRSWGIDAVMEKNGNKPKAEIRTAKQVYE